MSEIKYYLELRIVGERHKSDHFVPYLQELLTIDTPVDKALVRDPNTGEMKEQAFHVAYSNRGLEYDGTAYFVSWEAGTTLRIKSSFGVPVSSFQLRISGLQNGMQGDYVLTLTSSGRTILLDISGGSEGFVNIKGNGSMDNLPAGTYHFCWVFDGDLFTWNFARYV